MVLELIRLSAGRAVRFVCGSRDWVDCPCFEKESGSGEIRDNDVPRGKSFPSPL